MYKSIFILLLLSSFSFAKVFITVTYPVERFFIKRIAENTIYIKTIFDEENFDTNDISQIKKFSNSNYYFNFNLEDEQKIEAIFKARNNSIKIFHMLEGIPRVKANDGKANPYVWLDPLLVRKLAENLYNKLIEIEPESKDIYRVNYESFLSELDEMFLDIKQRVETSKTFGFFAFSDELYYFAKRFRLNIYHEDAKLLHVDEVLQLLKFSRKKNIKHLLVPINCDYRIAQSFCGHIDGKLVEYNLYTYNWKVNLYSILRGIETN
ncbi:metal ABC transporter solute-binding protein, Zn/Mn family [Halarcobacter ebronensis]|uniref:ABC transporter substrate-binding protein n=1 Tax=Halarcobacter ebronensis TaxID=1462615 RepID=A0A4Q1AG01_9BACT|nr:zinc ABC transporter substrate-binding protein [Halarcobacter ebronensis]QKF81458.1 hypothetical protein AEBR_0959 [Halarcobacter ebronensis]RXK02480.1 hypothetical protein CRV07_13500 [Halarcobacter ebronensis]